MRLRRPSVLFGAALVSAVLFVVTVVGWVRSYPHTGCLGQGRVREVTDERVVIDGYTLQGCRGQLWCGRCRLTVVHMLGFPRPPGEGAAHLEPMLGNLDVFGIAAFAGPLSGFGHVTGTTAEQVGLGIISYEIEGVVLPYWLLALVTAVLPAIWIIRRVRRSRAPTAS